LTRRICIDTNILFPYPFRIETENNLLEEYQSIKTGQTPILTKWEYIFYTDYDLLISPLAAWEYQSIRLRRLHDHKNIAADSQKVKVAWDALTKRFDIKVGINPLNLAISVLFGAATGTPCFDSYHFIHGIENKADFFVTNNRKDFLNCKKYPKEQVLSKVLGMLNKNKPIAVEGFLFLNTAISKISHLQIKKKTMYLFQTRWPEIITEPADLPL